MNSETIDMGLNGNCILCMKWIKNDQAVKFNDGI